MTEDVRYQADLTETPLAEVLEAVGSFGEPGVLEVVRAGMVKRVYLEAGYVVHASSSDPIDRLSEYIRRTGLVDEERIDAVDQERSNTNRRLGVLLVEQGLLTPRQVYESICGQIEEIVCSLFAWQSGRAIFESRRFDLGEMVQVMLPLRRVVFEGLKRSPRQGESREPVDFEAAVLAPSFRYEDLIEVGLDGDETDLLERVDGRTKVAELCSGSSFSSGECTRRLYAFEALSLVRSVSKVESESAQER
ncbi:MAG: DUF4388 domain-containing protein [Thermoanaerobaculia bacterium]|nr:DUF4388 domain-containing protein [Thermoanaerobaculia bacterium]